MGRLQLLEQESPCVVTAASGGVMREIVLIGLNHKTAAVDVRECIALTEDEADTALRLLRGNPDIGECVLLSTCNRLEVIMAADDGPRAADAVKRFLASFKNIPLDRFSPALYQYQGDDAVRHVFEVASSLDSMVVGEPQILGQMKAAYRSATIEKTSGPILNKLLHRTFFVAKKVRTETGIGDHAVSISYAAIELGKKIFGNLEGKRVLLIGAGEMAELAVEHLIRNRTGAIAVANRTFERAVALARRFSGQAVKFEEIAEVVREVDIVISSTGATNYILRKAQIRDLMRSRRNRSLFFIDIAVPRNIDPAINQVANAYVYDIDDLKGIVDENREDRQKEAVKARRIIDEAVIGFRKWYDTLAVVPTIVALREKAEILARRELDKTLASLDHLSDADKQAVSRMTHALINKILHDPTRFLRRTGCSGDKSVALDITRKLFNID